MGSISITSLGQYLIKPRVLEPRNIDLTEPDKDEVQIAPRSITLCGSDLHYFQNGRNGSITVKEPLCLGHECAGEVVLVGDAVEDFRVGDKVAVECGVPCSDCESCLEGRYNICPKLRFRSSGSAFPHFQGMLQEKINHPVRWTHRLPNSFTFDSGALLEPLAVACHAVRRAGMNPGSSCLIMGAGAVGLLCAAVARSRGCNRIVVCDINSHRVDFAVEEGFAEVGLTSMPRRSTNMEEAMVHARELATKVESQVWPNGQGVGRVDTVFECTGVPACVQTSIFATKSGGRVMLVGMGTPNYALPISEASSREIDLMPTWRYAHCYDDAIDIMSKAITGVVKPDITKLITHTFNGLKNVETAFERAGNSEDPQGRMVIKVVVHI